MLASAALVMGFGLTSCDKGGDENEPDPTPTPDGGGDKVDPSTSDNELVKEYLSGSSYVVLKMGETAFSVITENGASIVDLRPDDVNRFLYDWAGNSFAEGGASGLDAFGYADDWGPLVAHNGWAGVGLFVADSANTSYYADVEAKLAGNEADYSLVVIAKMSSADAGTWFQIYGFGEMNEIQIADEIAADGEWAVIEMPCNDLGTFSLDSFATNDDGFHEGNLYGLGGQAADLCAVFYVKK